MRNYSDFAALKGSMFISYTCSILIVAVGYLFFNDYRENQIHRRDLYDILSRSDRMIHNADALEMTHLVRAALLTPHTLQEFTEFMARAKNLKSDGLYSDIILDETDILIDIVQKKQPPPHISVPGFASFFFYAFMLVYIITSAMAILELNLRSAAWSDNFWVKDWAWSEPWLYGAIVLLAPTLIVAVLVNFLKEGLVLLYLGIACAIVLVVEEVWPKLRRRSRTLPTPTAEAISENSHETVSHIPHSEVAETRDAFANYYIQSVDAQRLKLVKLIEQIKLDLKNRGESISYKQRELAQAQADLKAFDDTSASLKCKKRIELLNEFDRLQRMPKIRKLVFDTENAALLVYTNTIYITHRLRTYEIGSFRITISMAAGTVGAVTNLSSTHPEGLHHPYASAGGYCSGQYATLIQEALQKQELAVALSYMLKTMQSAEGDKPDFVKQWKDVTNVSNS